MNSSQNSYPRLSPKLEDAALELAGGRLERDFYGYAGAGPLTVAVYQDDVGQNEGVHIGLGDQGVYLTPFAARDLARFIELAAKGCGS